MRIGGRIGIGFGAALAVSGGLAALSWVASSDLGSTLERVDHTNEVLRTVDQTLADLVDIETSARGFALTGTEPYLVPYETAIRRAPVDLMHLERLLADDPGQRARVRRLEAVALRRIGISSSLVRVRRDQGAAAAAASVGTGRGKSAMDEARAIIGTIRSEEIRLLDVRTEQERQRTDAARWIAIASAGLMALLALAATLALTRSITNPLRSLSGAARRVGGGERITPPESMRRDEIGDVARALDVMAREHELSTLRTRALLGDAGEAFFLADLDGRYTDVNVAACKLLGYERDELIGKTIVDLIPPDDVPRLAVQKQRLLSSGAGVTSEWTLERKDGVRIPVEVTAKILPDGRWQAFVHDIRERKRAEADLRESEERFRLTIDEAPIGMALVALDGRFIRVNNVLCEIVGYSREELTGLTFQAITHADDLDADLAFAAQLERGDIARYQLEKRYIRKDGSIVPIMLSGSAVRDATGAARYYIAQIEDITERVRAREERERLLQIERRHRQRLETIRESSLAISAHETASGASGVRAVLQSIADEARRVTGADYAALGVGADPSKPFEPWVWSGLSRDEAARIGRNPRPIGMLGCVVDDNKSLLVDHLRDHPKSIGMPAGHPPMDAYLGVPIRRNGDVVGNIYLTRRPGAAPFSDEDLAAVELLATHAAIAMENARLYDEVQAAVHAREDMLAVVSHDLRGPLAAVALRAQLVGREREPPKLEAHAQSIRRSVNTMQQLINGLLDEARLESGSLRLHLDETRISELAAITVETYAPIATQRRVRLDCRIPEMAPVSCDRDRVQQVLANLVANAVRFTPPGGTVTIAADAKPNELVVTVSDTGTGIDPDVLPHVFERYFTTARGQGGTGLGLFIVKGLVEAHGGRVWVDTRVGKGTTFSFSLPLQHATPAAGRAAG